MPSISARAHGRSQGAHEQRYHVDSWVAWVVSDLMRLACSSLLLASLVTPTAAIALHSLTRPTTSAAAGSAAATADADVDADSTAFARLVEAVVSEGGFVGSISVQTVGGLRGLYVQEDVSAGEPLLAVPHQCILLAVEGEGEGDEQELKLHERLMLRLLTAAASGERVSVLAVALKHVAYLTALCVAAFAGALPCDPARTRAAAARLVGRGAAAAAVRRAVRGGRRAARASRAHM